LTAEDVLELAENKRASTLVRVDAGGGEDADIDWLLHRHYGGLEKSGLITPRNLKYEQKSVMSHLTHYARGIVRRS
jgi:hypothetical protein